MIAETLCWVVLTRDAWVRATAAITSDSLRRKQPYETAQHVFGGRCVEVVHTLGM